MSIAFCLLCAAMTYYALFTSTARDEKEYRRLMLVSNPSLAGDDGEAPYIARQKREGVQKDFSYLKGANLLKVRLVSCEAELVLDKQKESTQIVEEMCGIKAYMQEELFYLLSDGREASLQANGRLLIKGAPAKEKTSWLSLDDPGAKPMQQLRYLEAASGFYSYKSDRCVAHNVLIERYLIEGHELTEDFSGACLILKGTAAKVEFTMDGQDPHFTAENLKASISMPERI